MVRRLLLLVHTRSRGRLPTYAIQHCSTTLRPTVRLKEDYNTAMQYKIIRKVIITRADLRPGQLTTDSADVCIINTIKK